MTELDLLHALLLLALALAPLGTRLFFDERSKAGDAAHAVAWLCAAAGLLFPFPALCVVWLLYCAGNFGHFLWRRGARLRSLYELASCIPFLFSNIAAVWLVGGANDLRVLGYGTAFSYYAALHGNVLGWMIVGAIALLASEDRPHRKLYVACVYLSFVSFLLIAIGIDAIAAIKPIGVAGLSIAIPIAQLAFLRDVRQAHKGAFALGILSFAGLCVTFVLAWQNELGALSLSGFLGSRAMVSVHGLLNGAVVAPCFLLAVALDVQHRGPRSVAQSPTNRP